MLPEPHPPVSLLWILPLPPGLWYRESPSHWDSFRPSFAIRYFVTANLDHFIYQASGSKMPVANRFLGPLV